MLIIQNARIVSFLEQWLIFGGIVSFLEQWCVAARLAVMTQLWLIYGSFTDNFKRASPRIISPGCYLCYKLPIIYKTTVDINNISSIITARIKQRGVYIMNDWTIGTIYTTRDKFPRVCTVVDVYKTYNAAGALVKTKYVATHPFAGGVVTDYDVCAVSIARGQPGGA